MAFHPAPLTHEVEVAIRKDVTLIANQARKREKPANLSLRFVSCQKREHIADRKRTTIATADAHNALLSTSSSSPDASVDRTKLTKTPVVDAAMRNTIAPSSLKLPRGQSEGQTRLHSHPWQRQQ